MTMQAMKEKAATLTNVEIQVWMLENAHSNDDAIWLVIDVMSDVLMDRMPEASFIAFMDRMNDAMDQAA